MPEAVKTIPGRSRRALRAHRRAGGLRHLGVDPGLLEIAGECSRQRNPRASLRLDHPFPGLVAELARTLARAARSDAVPAGADVLLRQRPRDLGELAGLHLGGECWTRHRDEPRLFHDAARERPFRRALFARTPDALAVYLGNARARRRPEPDLRLRQIPLARRDALRLLWPLRAAPEKIRRAADPRPFPGDDFADAAGRRLPRLPPARRNLHVRFRAMVARS